MDGAAASDVSFPEIAIEVTPDRLEARALVSPRGGEPAHPVERQQLLDELARAGIVHGVESAAIDMFVDAWNAGTPLTEAVVVARGAPPTSAEAGAPELLVAAITDPAAVERARLLAPSHYQEVAEVVQESGASRVDPGQALMRFEKIADARPGTAVDGETLQPGPPRLPVVLGRGVVFDPCQMSATAAHSGIVLYDSRTLAVLPLAFDARVDVAIAPEGLSCSVSLFANGPGGSPLTVESVTSKLGATGVKAGVIPDAVETAVAEACSHGKATAEVARGLAPQHGVDARLEHLVDLDPPSVPLAEEGGRVDFKSISIIRSVSAGQPLVRRHPGSKGVPGFAVTGRPLPARDGRDVRLPSGRNVGPDPADPDLLLAKVDGNVRQIGPGALEVSECFVVKQDVDYSTGHINYERSVIVRGDVKGGFNLAVGGDLEVAGLAEDSTIKVGGNVLIRRGFVGQGQGSIEARGRVLLGFGRNQKVTCAGALTIEREAVNMNLASRDAVVVTGWLVGGHTSARNRIVCKVLGNSGGSRTELEVGVDHDVLEKRARIGEGIDKLKRQLAAGQASRQTVEELWQLASSFAGVERPNESPSLSPDDISSLIKVLEEKRRLCLEQAYITEGSCVVVQDKAWPGAQIQIAGSSVLKVTDLLPGPLVFRLREGEVRWA